MSKRILIIASLAAALAAAAPAWAQRASLADRVALLEQRAGDNQASVALLNEVNQLKGEVQALRAQVEELQQLTEQLKQSSKNQYLDLDDRLNRLEGAAGTATPPAAAAPAAGKPATPTAGKSASTKPVAASPTAKPAATGPVERPPSVYGDAGKLAQGAGERADYEAAFSTLKAGRYAESARMFTTFLQQYPNGVYTPNALYWLGEGYYVTQAYPPARAQFQALLDRYPTHDKAPGALLKLGLVQQGMKQLDAAESSFKAVVTRFPGTDAARTAGDRLRALEIARISSTR